jgi:hypothetical protein
MNTRIQMATIIDNLGIALLRSDKGSVYFLKRAFRATVQS